MCVAALVLVVAGCSVPGVGGPPPFVGPELPPRPRDVLVRGVDPCALLPEEQRAEIGLETPPLLTSREEGSEFFEGPTMVCTSVAFRPVAFGVLVELTYEGLGIGALTGRPVSSELTVIEVQGFPAVLSRPQDPLFCEVLVDLGPGSSLSVQYREGGRGTLARDELCDGVQRVADAAAATLLGLA